MEKGKKKVESDEPQNEILPDDIIVDHIMPKLPIKPLIRFKCVSKSWQSTISTPQFAKSHLKSHSSPPSQQFLLFSGNRSSPKNPPFTAVTIDEHGRIEESSTLDFTYSDGVPIHVVGSCNGLVCFLDKYFKFSVCNPVTRQCCPIPDVCDPDIASAKIIAAGFGYVSSIDDYVIACFIHDSEHEHPMLGGGFYDDALLDEIVILDDIKLGSVNTFSLRTRKWAKLRGADQLEGAGICRADKAVLFNDTFYWFAASINHVVGVNVVNGEFSKIPSPIVQHDHGFPDIFERVRLCVTKGRLLLCKGKELWVLDEYGLGWVQLNDLNYDGMRLLCVSDATGRWLVLNNGILALLEPSKSYSRQYQGGTRFGGAVFSAWDFKMSLISP